MDSAAVLRNGDKGAALPMADWGNEFSESLPEKIREAILKARGEGPNTLTDEEYRKRLQDKFGSRWTRAQKTLKDRGAMGIFLGRFAAFLRSLMPSADQSVGRSSLRSVGC